MLSGTLIPTIFNPHKEIRVQTKNKNPSDKHLPMLEVAAQRTYNL
jgi:hypothetical protein